MAGAGFVNAEEMAVSRAVPAFLAIPLNCNVTKCAASILAAKPAILAGD
jgi:hypothetical protein